MIPRLRATDCCLARSMCGRQHYLIINCPFYKVFGHVPNALRENWVPRQTHKPKPQANGIVPHRVDLDLNLERVLAQT